MKCIKSRKIVYKYIRMFKTMCLHNVLLLTLLNIHKELATYFADKSLVSAPILF